MITLNVLENTLQ